MKSTFTAGGRRRVVLLSKALEEMVRRSDEGAPVETAHFGEILSEVRQIVEHLEENNPWVRTCR